MIGHLVIAVLVFAGVLGPIELLCELSHRRTRRKRADRRKLIERYEQQLRARLDFRSMPTPTPWSEEPWL